MKTRERIDPSQLDLRDTVVSINRVTKVVKGGKNLSFSALVVVGDGHGVVGFGVGKAKEVPSAIKKGIEAAKKGLIRVPLQGTTVPHPIVGKFGAGSVLLKQPAFAKKIAQLIRKTRPNAQVVPLERSGVWGAVALAREQFKIQNSKFKDTVPETSNIEHPTSNIEPAPKLPLSPTELRHPLSLRLDKLSIAKSIELFLAEDAKLPIAVLGEKAKIAKVIGWIVQSFQKGGRLFYVGAGTSGRLGILDASECPPTFRTPAELVQGIIAGGQQAIWHAIEGAEDDPIQGADAVAFREVGPKDVVVGIAASGRTPFVWGALDEAKKRGAKTALVCFNPHVVSERKGRADVIIAPATGPELLTGSTRLKSGTATKLILNLLTTVSMVRTGKVISNLMVDVNPSNIKLRGRAVRIVRELTGVEADTAKTALEKSGWVVKEAVLGLRNRA